MAGTALVSNGVTWHVGLHAFMPIVERIRAGYAEKQTLAPETVFSSIEDGFDLISLKELSPQSFNEFYAISQTQLDRLSRDESLTFRGREFLSLPWAQLQNLLRQDERYVAGLSGLEA